MTLVTESYRHGPKQAAPGELLRLSGSRLKWYGIARPGVELTDALVAEGRAHLHAEAEAGRLAVHRDVGFVLLHHCTSVAFLIVCVWRNDNELWKTVYIKDLPGDGEFEEQVYRGLGAMLCVWELGVVGHEQQAWTRYLCSARDDDALETYLEDRFEGMV